jgi:predicted nucleic acid-binding protein
MTTINVGEVWYNISRTSSDELADGAIHRIRTLDIEIIPADWDLTYRAAKFKTLGNIACANCFAAALAIRESAVLLTGDREFTVLEDKINIHWL